MADIYAALAATLSKEEIEKEVEKKIADFHGLLTREVALKLIAKERGLYKEEEQIVKIKDIKPSMRRLTVSGKIIAIDKEKTYSSGKRARSIIIKDDTGHVSVTLWNQDIQIISKLKIGDEILVKNAYEKIGNLSLGYKGTIEIINTVPYTPLAELIEGPVNVRAFISAVGEKKEYEKNNRKFTYISFSINDSISEQKCVLWSIPDMDKMTVGNEIIIQNGLFRENEIHLNNYTRLLIRKATNVVNGTVNDVRIDNNKLVFIVDNRTLTFNRENALKLLDTSVSDDINLETIVTLKKESLLNKNIYIRCKEENGEYVILE